MIDRRQLIIGSAAVSVIGLPALAVACPSSVPVWKSSARGFDGRIMNVRLAVTRLQYLIEKFLLSYEGNVNNAHERDEIASIILEMLERFSHVFSQYAVMVDDTPELLDRNGIEVRLILYLSEFPGKTIKLTVGLDHDTLYTKQSPLP